MATKLNGPKYCYVSQTIQLNIICLHINVNDQTVLFQTIQFGMSTDFVYTQLNDQTVLF